MHERENFIRGHPTQIFEHGAPPVDGVRDSVTSARANAVRLSQRMDVRHTSLSLAEPERGDQHVPALDALDQTHFDFISALGLCAVNRSSTIYHARGFEF